MKNLITLVILLLLLCCKDKHAEKAVAARASSVQKKEIKVTDAVRREDIAEENPRGLVQHLLIANGGTIMYLKNGEIKKQARFDTDGDWITEMMKFPSSGTFQEFDGYLVDNRHIKSDFFDENGKVYDDWKILNGRDVLHPQQVVSYAAPKNPNPKTTEEISKTCLIIPMPETKVFKDENSPEADNYFTAMDDWSWYSAHLREEFEKLGVKELNVKKPYLSFKIGDEKMVLDPRKNINGVRIYALLYKENKPPIWIDLNPDLNDWDGIKGYLRD